MGSVGCRSLREKGDIHAGIEQGVNFGIHNPGMPATSSAQENRVILLCQPASERPLAYLRLGNEGHRSQGINGENIQPGDVIGDNQAARGSIGRLRLKLNGKNLQYLVRPALFESGTLSFADHRIKQRRSNGNPHQMEQQPQAAEDTEQ